MVTAIHLYQHDAHHIIVKARVGSSAPAEPDIHPAVCATTATRNVQPPLTSRQSEDSRARPGHDRADRRGSRCFGDDGLERVERKAWRIGGDPTTRHPSC